MDFEQITGIFKATLGIDAWTPQESYKETFEKMANHARLVRRSTVQCKLLLTQIIAHKFDLYHRLTKAIYDHCAKYKVFFNYSEKEEISKAMNCGNADALYRILAANGINFSELKPFVETSIHTPEEILRLFEEEISTDPKREEIIESVYAAFLYHSFCEKDVHALNTGKPDGGTTFYQYLKKEFPHKYDRTHALAILNIDSELYSRYRSYNHFLSAACEHIREQWRMLQNYSYLAILIQELPGDEESTQWRLYSDLVLYGEKFIEEPLQAGYFHPDKIQAQTQAYIPRIDTEKARFDLCNTGFTYKDCIILSNDKSLADNESYAGYSLLVLFQKNERDEETIPCPACRSFQVRGNSYPSLGVKSWECQNPVCPDKSKYNRGKRYSMAQIVKQEAIANKNNEIDKQLIAEWKLDVVAHKSIEQIIDYLVSEYSFHGDSVWLYNCACQQTTIKGRRVVCAGFDYKAADSRPDFFSSCYFQRFLVKAAPTGSRFANISGLKGIQIYHGNCLHVLNSLPPDSIDGAVTSPPYYNAREYSHWDNIYCYLYDMYNQASALFATLKPGGYYLFNIFDYFDNENNIVFSAMGKKRMILGAYIVCLFRRIGFRLIKNIIWYKGQIQGHRNTNQGNLSPYYQSPLNCYEHIFCFQKPGGAATLRFPDLINLFPVVKMINGENKLGHTAPFPEKIPELLTRQLRGGCIADPYAGSFTTALNAARHGLASISIEQSEAYCQLGIQRLSKPPLPFVEE